jgi:hypothetical protein
LKDIAKTIDGYASVKLVIKKLWSALPKIHKHWGFSGGFDKEGVFFDHASMKITVLNWDRSQLPMYHITAFDDGLKKWDQKERFSYVYKTYGQRLINGFDKPKSIFAADKEALLVCLLDCRQISRESMPTESTDMLRKPLRRYN